MIKVVQIETAELGLDYTKAFYGFARRRHARPHT